MVSLYNISSHSLLSVCCEVRWVDKALLLVRGSGLGYVQWVWICTRKVVVDNTVLTSCFSTLPCCSGLLCGKCWRLASPHHKGAVTQAAALPVMRMGLCADDMLLVAFTQLHVQRAALQLSDPSRAAALYSCEASCAGFVWDRMFFATPMAHTLVTLLSHASTLHCRTTVEQRQPASGAFICLHWCMSLRLRNRRNKGLHWQVPCLLAPWLLFVMDDAPCF